MYAIVCGTCDAYTSQENKERGGGGGVLRKVIMRKVIDKFWTCAWFFVKAEYHNEINFVISVRLKLQR